MAKILLVDDEVMLLYALGKVLSNAGHQVITAGNGIEAEKMFILHAPDLIITDLIMPDKEGLGLITVLRRKHPSVPIIAISAGGRGNSGLYLNMAKCLGATYTLSKPFTGTQLLTVIESVMLKHTNTCPLTHNNPNQFAEKP
jgi:DNA-binding response OmpR family regulator